MSDRIVSLPFGTSRTQARLPGRFVANTLAPARIAPLPDPASQILSLLRRETSSETRTDDSLENMCRGVKRVLIISSDRTRVTGAKTYLPVLLDFLAESGVDQKGIEILVANGMHAPAGPEVLSEFLPSDVLGKCSVSEHDCYHAEAHFYAGSTTRGTRVFLNKKAGAAQLVIVTGSIGLHYFAGFRGGRKSVLPGIAAFETICSNHRLTIPGGEGFHPLCKNGSLSGNPVHEDMLEALPMIPPSFLLNTITDASGNIVDVFTGNPVDAHLRGCDAFKKTAEAVVEEKADCVIVSCGGYPRDVTLIQAHKAMENVRPVLKEGGSMVVLAECKQGIGSDTLMSWFDGEDLARVRRRLVSNYTLHGHTALAMMEKLKSFKIYLVSSLKRDVVASIGLIPAESVEVALQDISSKTSGELNTIIFPEGSETLAMLKD